MNLPTVWARKLEKFLRFESQMYRKYTSIAELSNFAIFFQISICLQDEDCVADDLECTEPAIDLPSKKKSRSIRVTSRSVRNSITERTKVLTLGENCPHGMSKMEFNEFMTCDPKTRSSVDKITITLSVLTIIFV